MAGRKGDLSRAIPGGRILHRSNRASLPGPCSGSGTMATLAYLVGFRSERSLLGQVAGRLEGALKRVAAGRYAEQRERVARTGGAGMI